MADPLGIGFAPLGFHPTMRRDEMPWMPKSRYAIMRRYMPKVGTLGLDMMTRTCTVQVNLDYSDEADMARKLRVSLALQPVATALFANSPFIEGKPSGFLSSRAQVWTDTDTGPQRHAAADFRGGVRLRALRRVAAGRADVFRHARRPVSSTWPANRSAPSCAGGPNMLPGGPATMGDFADHMTTAFTDVRIKRFLEMRGADAGRPDMMVAQSALWTGLLYDEAALHAAEALVRRHDWADYVALRGEVPRRALDAPFAGGTVRDLARDMVAIAARRAACAGDAGQRRRRTSECSCNRCCRCWSGGPTQAEHWLARYSSDWLGDVSKIWDEADV